MRSTGRATRAKQTQALKENAETPLYHLRGDGRRAWEAAATNSIITAPTQPPGGGGGAASLCNLLSAPQAVHQFTASCLPSHAPPFLQPLHSYKLWVSAVGFGHVPTGFPPTSLTALTASSSMQTSSFMACLSTLPFLPPHHTAPPSVPSALPRHSCCTLLLPNSYHAHFPHLPCPPTCHLTPLGGMSSHLTSCARPLLHLACPLYRTYTTPPFYLVCLRRTTTILYLPTICHLLPASDIIFRTAFATCHHPAHAPHHTHASSPHYSYLPLGRCVPERCSAPYLLGPRRRGSTPASTLHLRDAALRSIPAPATAQYHGGPPGTAGRAGQAEVTACSHAFPLLIRLLSLLGKRHLCRRRMPYSE